MRGIAVPSSGDPVKDQEDIRRAALHQARLDESLCPNGCGPMAWEDPHNAHCPECKFIYFCSAPFGGTGKHYA